MERGTKWHNLFGLFSVDLQTKTATFQSGMSDAAKAARGSFNDIKQGAREMGAETGYSMGEARHSVQLLSEEFGLHLPRGVTSFLASLGPVGAAMEAAFPFLAIAVGATFLIEKLTKLGDEAAKSGKEWTAISEDVSKWGENSRKELLDVQIQLDKLNGDKLKELQDTLKKIDLTTLEHLKSEFDGVSKKADEAFTKMRSGWLMTQIGMGNGVADVQEMFASAMDKINADLAKGDQKQLASDLKAASDQMWNLAAPTYDLVQRLHEAHNETGATRISADEHYQALLKAHGVMVGMTKELTDQEKIEKGKAALATASITPIHDATDPRVAAERKKDLAGYMETAKQKAAATEKLAEEEVAANDAFTRYLADEYRKRTELAFQVAEQQHAASTKANDEEVKNAESTRKISQMVLSSGASAYLISKQAEQAGIRALLEKEQTDLQAAHQREVAEQQGFISQMQGLAASSSGKEQVSALAQAAQAQDKLTASARQYNEELARTNAAITSSDLASQKLNNTWALFFHQTSSQLQSLTSTLSGEFQQAIKKTFDGFGQGVAKSIVEGKSLGSSMRQVAREMTESMIEHLVQWGAQDVISKLTMKGAAATLAGANATASFAAAPWPIDMGAPAFGASAMASALAFEQGGIVPGIGRGDTVPAVLTPGEGVIEKKVMDQLVSNAKFGRSGSGNGDVHVHHHATYNVHAIDADGVHQMLREHGDKFTNHAVNTLRKMNR